MIGFSAHPRKRGQLRRRMAANRSAGLPYRPDGTARGIAHTRKGLRRFGAHPIHVARLRQERWRGWLPAWLPPTVPAQVAPRQTLGESGVDGGAKESNHRVSSGAPANGPDCIEIAAGRGDCGVRSLVVTDPALFRFDLSTSKRVAIHDNTNFEFRAEFLNAFNTPWFEAVATASNNPNNYRVTDADSGRRVQFVFRVNW
jgi:hypothetical protein